MGAFDLNTRPEDITIPDKRRQAVPEQEAPTFSGKRANPHTPNDIADAGRAKDLGYGGRNDNGTPMSNAVEGMRITEALQRRSAKRAAENEEFKAADDAFVSRVSANRGKAPVGLRQLHGNESQVDRQKYIASMTGAPTGASETNAGNRKKYQDAAIANARENLNRTATAKSGKAFATTDEDRQRNADYIAADMAKRGIKGSVTIQGEKANYAAAGDGSGKAAAGQTMKTLADAVRTPRIEVADAAGNKKMVSPADAESYSRIPAGKPYGGMTIAEATTARDRDVTEAADAFATKKRMESAMTSYLKDPSFRKQMPSEVAEAERSAFVTRSRARRRA